MARKTLTEYEQKQLEKIRRNDEMVASLMLHRKVSDLSAATAKLTSPKSFTSPALKRAKSDAPVVIRRSLRHRGLPPDSSEESTPSTPPAAAPLPTSEREGLRLDEAYVRPPELDRGFVSVVLGMEDHAPLRKRVDVVDADDWDPVEDLSLKVDNVKRFLPGRILDVRFSERSVVAAEDKLGNLGFWDADHREGEGDGVICLLRIRLLFLGFQSTQRSCRRYSPEAMMDSSV